MPKYFDSFDLSTDPGWSPGKCKIGSYVRASSSALTHSIRIYLCGTEIDHIYQSRVEFSSRQCSKIAETLSVQYDGNNYAKSIIHIFIENHNKWHCLRATNSFFSFRSNFSLWLLLLLLLMMVLFVIIIFSDF